MTHAGFWDGIAERYAARPLDNEAAYLATLERVRHWLRPGMRVVELGCGTGSTALRLCDAVADYLGTDFSSEMIRIAEARSAEAGASARFAVAEAGAAPGDVDAVLAFNLLHLVEDREAVLAHVRGMLGEGGLFLSKTPCLAAKIWLKPVIWGMRCFGKAPPGVRFFRPVRLEAEVVAAGFEIVETGDYPKSLPNHFIVARAV